MSQATYTLLGGILTVVLLLIFVTRTVLVEFRAGRGGEVTRGIGRTVPVIALDIAGIVLGVALVVILVIPLAAALGN
jgi:hypothetical protein